MALNNIFKKIFILNSSHATVNFQEVMLQLAPRVTVRQTNLGIQQNREIRADAYGWFFRKLLFCLILTKKFLPVHIQTRPWPRNR